MVAFATDLSLDSSSSPKRTARISRAARSDSSSPGLKLSSQQDNSLSILMDTSLGEVLSKPSSSRATRSKAQPVSPQKSRKRPPLGSSPLKNIAFSTNLGRISEVPTLTGDDKLLAGIDEDELEKMALEMMELEARANRRQSKSRFPEESNSRSKKAPLPVLHETSGDLENVTPFVQLSRGRSKSKSPVKPPPVLLPEVEEKNAKKRKSSSSEQTPKKKHASIALPVTAKDEVSKPAEKRVTLASPAKPTKLPRSSIAKVPQATTSEEETALRHKSRRSLAAGLLTATEPSLVGPIVKNPPAKRIEQPVSPKKKVITIQTSPTKAAKQTKTLRSSTKIPRKSLAVSAQETREERRARLSLSLSPTKEQVPAPATQAEVIEAVVQAKSPNRPKKGQDDVAPSEVQALVSQETPSLVTQPSPQQAKQPHTERRRSTRLSLKSEAVASPVADSRPTTVKRISKPSLTFPVTTLARKEVAIQKSAVTQARKSAAAPSLTAAISKILAKNPNTAPTTVNGRNLRHRKSLVAPPSVPTTVIGGKFRPTANGELVPVSSLEGAAFRFTTNIRGARQSEALKRKLAEEEKAKTYKANPVPSWIKKRKLELEQTEEARLLSEIQEAREAELTKQKKKRIPSSSLTKKAPMTKTVSKPFVSSVDARLAERQKWEEKRRMKEELIEVERDKARREREIREEEEYKEARKRAVPKANPLPEYLKCADHQPMTT